MVIFNASLLLLVAATEANLIIDVSTSNVLTFICLGKLVRFSFGKAINCNPYIILMKKIFILAFALATYSGFSQCETFNMVPCKPGSLAELEPTEQSATVLAKHGEKQVFTVDIKKGIAYDLVVCYETTSSHGIQVMVKDADTNELLHADHASNGSSLIQFRGGQSRTVNVSVNLSEKTGMKPSEVCLGLAVFERK
jgi:hypothetical protein